MGSGFESQGGHHPLYEVPADGWHIVARTSLIPWHDMLRRVAYHTLATGEPTAKPVTPRGQDGDCKILYRNPAAWHSLAPARNAEPAPKPATRNPQPASDGTDLDALGFRRRSDGILGMEVGGCRGVNSRR